MKLCAAGFYLPVSPSGWLLLNPLVHVTSADEIILQLRPSGTVFAQPGADPGAPTMGHDDNFMLGLTQLGPAEFASREYSCWSKVSPGVFLSVCILHLTQRFNDSQTQTSRTSSRFGLHHFQTLQFPRSHFRVKISALQSKRLNLKSTF